MIRILVWILALLVIPFGTYAQLPSNEMRVHFIDVSQGDATLLEFSCGAILIDAGGKGSGGTADLIEYLTDFFVARPDLNSTLASIIITHNHVDHTLSLREVVEEFTVLRVIEHGKRGWKHDRGDKDVKWVISSTDVPVIDVDDADITDTGGFTSADMDPLSCSGTDPDITLLSADFASNTEGWPKGDFNDKNNHSVVTRIDFGAASFLFTGDLETKAIETLAAFYDGTDMLDVDVYQAGHHGASNGTTVSLVTAMSPEIAVISMSKWNDRRAHTAYRYGHPRDDTIEALENGITGQRTSKDVMISWKVKRFKHHDMSKAIYATGWDGNVIIKATSAGNYTVELEKP